MFEFYDNCKPSLVPEISDEQVEEMLASMKPLYKVNHVRFRAIDIDNVDRRRTAYQWDPLLSYPVKVYLDSLNSRVIPTFHTYGYYGFFKPSLAEVCACIRSYVPNWQVIRFFWLDPTTTKILGEFHTCECHLFGDEELSVQDDSWGDFATECFNEGPPSLLNDYDKWWRWTLLKAQDEVYFKHMLDDARFALQGEHLGQTKNN